MTNKETGTFQRFFNWVGHLNEERRLKKLYKKKMKELKRKDPHTYD